MKLGLRFSLLSAVVLVTLSGCGRGFFQGAERAPWRHEAEVACLKSGEVKLGVGAVQIEPIEGPGVCGADFPLRVTGLGEGLALSFADDMRPPAAIPGATYADMPRWPQSGPHYAPPPPPGEHMRWVTGPPGIPAPGTGAPMSLAAPEAPAYAPPTYVPSRLEPRYAPPPPAARTVPDDIPRDAIVPPGGSAAVPERGTQPRYNAPTQRGAYNAPVYQPEQRQRALPSLGPMRGPYSPASIPQASLTPAATLACPLVSALDRWVSEGVQPAALHWFNSPVVTIKQISAYSCREMVGAGTNHISEHAFGNALDIAGFTLADGRTILVKNGWHGSPEEQGFLHDVQLYACETFNTVLAPGYNPEHYNHIHVDLMRRASGRRPCRPDAIPGEVVAARARAHYAGKRDPLYTGSIAKLIEKLAIPGADGDVEDHDADQARDKLQMPSYLGRPTPLPAEERVTAVH